MEKGGDRGVLQSLRVRHLMNESPVFPVLIISYIELFFLLSNNPILILSFLTQFTYFAFPHFHLLFWYFFIPSFCVQFFFSLILSFWSPILFHSTFCHIWPWIFKFFCENTTVTSPLPSPPRTQTCYPRTLLPQSCASPSTPPQPKLFGSQSTVLTGKRKPDKVVS